jgi:hypothetical protein
MGQLMRLESHAPPIFFARQASISHQLLLTFLL